MTGRSDAGAAAVRAVIALGSNLGDRDHTLRQAVADIRAIDGVELVAASHPIESVAVTLHGPDEDKPSYVNGVAVVSTTLAPEKLLTELNRIEAEHGRVRLERWGDRTLDLDLIVHGDTTLDSDRLTLPHPRAAERSFVLQPWLEVDADAVLPGVGRVDVVLRDLGESVTVVPGAPSLDVLLVTEGAGGTA